MNGKAVFISPVNVFEKNGNGGSKASYEHLKMLQNMYGEKNVKVILFLTEKEKLEQSHNELVVNFTKPISNFKLLFASFWGCRVYMPWQEKEILNEIESFKPQIVFFDYSIEGRLVKKMNKYKCIVFFHNIEADYTYNRMKENGVHLLPAYIAAKRNDYWAAKFADTIICFNKRDSQRLMERYSRSADYCIPITFEDNFDKELVSKREDNSLLFLGSCFGPNLDGIEWFVNKVMPNIPDVSLYIVGKGFENVKAKLEKYSNVHVIGTVDFPSEYYYQYRVVVMPIRYGAGMKVKTAEAMMYGCHIIASDEALEGYDVEGISGIDRCNHEKEYINAIKTIFDRHEDVLIEEEVRGLFLNQYETQKVNSDFVNIVRNTIYG